jgi:hypothetical protein
MKLSSLLIPQTELLVMFCLPIPTLIYLWEIYIFPGSVCLFCWAKDVDQSWEYIIRWQTHECENWDWGRAQFSEKEYINEIFVAVNFLRINRSRYTYVFSLQVWITSRRAASQLRPSCCLRSSRPEVMAKFASWTRERTYGFAAPHSEGKICIYACPGSTLGESV